MIDMNMPLSGVKVVELGTHVAVPQATRAMADCGADVIKVEPVGGEEWRMIGRNYSLPITADENALFTNQNANKRFIALDIKTPEGLAILKQLMSDADVFVTNVRLKALSKMGIDYDATKETHPRLIYCHLTGFGYDGPDKDKPGFDMAAFWARSGAMVDWSDKGQFPVKPIGAFGDIAASNFLLSGTLTALFARQSSGRGTLVMTSLYGSAIWMNGHGLVQCEHPSNDYPKSRYAPANPFVHIYMNARAASGLA